MDLCGHTRVPDQAGVREVPPRGLVSSAWRGPWVGRGAGWVRGGRVRARTCAARDDPGRVMGDERRGAARGESIAVFEIGGAWLRLGRRRRLFFEFFFGFGFSCGFLLELTKCPAIYQAKATSKRDTLWCSKYDTNFQILFYLFFSSFSLIFLLFLLYLYLFLIFSHFFSYIYTSSDIVEESESTAKFTLGYNSQNIHYSSRSEVKVKSTYSTWKHSYTALSQDNHAKPKPQFNH